MTDIGMCCVHSSRTARLFSIDPGGSAIQGTQVLRQAAHGISSLGFFDDVDHCCHIHFLPTGCLAPLRDVP
jgi:hypothetical protein